jgi:hypothetical protein
VKTLILSVALTVAAVVLAPTARADMRVGNYELQTARDPFHSWVWFVSPCASSGCVYVTGIPRPNGGAAPFDGNAQLVNGRYTLTIDDPVGLSCLGYTIPVHDTYTWDAATLTGSVDSTFASDCGRQGPGTYPFTLARL